ncbi:DUF1574 family protein [Silvanigrella sp.]|jgi:hypothetical protein|uniref:DUF1574 family protein n=1 Tax=Silvanigrella sp. TaxID=2024976 RepID=UPI0037C7069A
MKQEKFFLLIYLSTILILMILISLFNYIVDPINIFNKSKSGNKEFELKLAESLTVHRCVALSKNFDERKFIRARINIESDLLKPNVIVVGSSRVLKIGNYLIDKNIFNLGVSGASIEDIVAILDLATKKFKPNILLIGVDPWIFNDDSGQQRWMTLSEEYKKGLSGLNLDSQKYSSNHQNKYEELIGIAYTKESLKFLYHNFVQKNSSNIEYPDSDKPIPGKNIIMKDGSLVYNSEMESITQESLIVGDNKNLLGPSMLYYSFSNYRNKIFKALIRKYNKNYKVILLLSPYHPYIYNEALKRNPILQEVENQIHSIAYNENISVIGSYNPDKVNCTPLEFYDGVHSKGSCMRKIIQKIDAF